MKMLQMMKDSLLTKFSTLCSQNDYNKLRKFNSKLKVWYSNRCTTLFEKECTYRFWLADYYFLIKVVYKTVNLYYSFPEDQIKIISWSYQQKTNWQRVKYIWFNYDLVQKYYTPQVQPDQGSNSWPPDHDSTFHVTEMPALNTPPSVTALLQFSWKSNLDNKRNP